MKRVKINYEFNEKLSLFIYLHVIEGDFFETNENNDNNSGHE